MIYDVYQIGKAMSGREDDESLDPLYQTDKIADIDYVLSIDFDVSDRVPNYKGISIIEHNKSLNSEQYLLRKGGSNGPNFAPSAKKTEMVKTVEKKLLAWFRDTGKSSSTQLVSTKIAEYLEHNLTDICNELEERSPADKKAKLLLTVRIGDKFPKDVPEFLERYKSTIEQKVTGTGGDLRGTCCLCNNPENKIGKEGGEKMMASGNEIDKQGEKITRFLARYNFGLDTPLKQALVLTGVLVQKVLNIQAYNLSGSTAFRNRLKGFKMRQGDVAGVITEAVTKMAEFESYSMESKRIYGEAMRLFFMSPAVWPLTSDQLVLLK